MSPRLTCGALRGSALVGPVATEILAVHGNRMWLRCPGPVLEGHSRFAAFDITSSEFVGEPVLLPGEGDVRAWTCNHGLVVETRTGVVLLGFEGGLTTLGNDLVLDVLGAIILQYQPDAHRVVIFDLRQQCVVGGFDAGTRPPVIVGAEILADSPGEALAVFDHRGNRIDTRPSASPFRARGLTMGERRLHGSTSYTHLSGGVEAVVEGEVAKVVANRHGFLALVHRAGGTDVEGEWHGARLTEPIQGECVQLHQRDDELMVSSTTDLLHLGAACCHWRHNTIFRFSARLTDEGLVGVFCGQIIGLGEGAATCLGTPVQRQALIHADPWVSVAEEPNGLRRVVCGALARLADQTQVRLDLRMGPLGAVIAGWWALGSYHATQSVHLAPIRSW